MESNENLDPAAMDAGLQATLDEADRLSTAAWTDAADMPTWMYPACGLWFAAVLVCLQFVWSSGWFVLPLLALVALEGYWLGWLAQRGGARPNLARIPPEFKRPIVGYFIGLFVIVGISMVLLERSAPIGFAFCAVASTLGLFTYRAHWYRAVSATRVRVAA